MSPERFNHLLSLVEPLVTKEDNNYRKSISHTESLALTIRFLVTGESQISLSFSFRIGKSAVSKIIAELVMHFIEFFFRSMSSHHHQTTSGKRYPKILRNSGIYLKQLGRLRENTSKSSALKIQALCTTTTKAFYFWQYVMPDTASRS